MPIQIESWHPEMPTSKGATAYHNAVVNASYYITSLDKLIKIVSKKIKNGNTVVDFGAGTGTSALFLLKNLKVNFKLWLVDNSPAWLSKAYETLSAKLNVKYFLLEKVRDRYSTLSETFGEESIDHVISANTFHLVPNLQETFKGINRALKPQGTLTFQSGNIIRNGREKGLLMIDDTFKRVHDIALGIVRANKKFAKYKKGINKRIHSEERQRKFVLPDPRPLDEYLNSLKVSGFKYELPTYKSIKILYKDWIDLLRVRRLQAGILPEVGGKEPSQEEEHDRDELITMASNKLFEELKSKNPLADNYGFMAEWTYVSAFKDS